jgi:thiol-disulfide isomerase/thioredoxin
MAAVAPHKRQCNFGSFAPARASVEAATAKICFYIMFIACEKVMAKKFIVFSIFSICFSNLLFSQNPCDLQKSSFYDLNTVDVEQIKCLAQNSDKDFTVFYTFAAWCGPCRKNLPDAINFSKEQNIDFYVLLMDRENDSYVKRAINYLDKIETKQKVVILSDSLYPPNLRNKKEKKIVLVDFGIQNRKKYTNFIEKITPPQFETIDDMSKYIILNKEGKVIFVSNYKDYKNEKGKDDDLYFFNKMKLIISNSRNNTSSLF